MAKMNAAIAALERRVGFPQSRARQVARSLQEAGALPLGGPGKSPELNLDDFVTLVIALAADVPLHQSADAVRTYRNLTPGGADVSRAPASVPRNAGEEIDAIFSLAADGNSDVRGIKLEFVANWPEVALHWHDGSAGRFRERGAIAAHWGASGHRRSTSINVAALADAIQETFTGA
ncbi:hypothetical protein [Ensifer adhaerens]|uniref:hypothetical protein n=1 Tax=Ensifer adhaerens TaxID=106592 RepID=UPI00131A38B8|nr:hypothetical protein [Ensifer adhaerens]